MDSKVNMFACRVCGKLQGDPPWGTDGQSPSYDICDCCGVEFGYGDCTLEAIHRARERWLAEGAYWYEIKERPNRWILEDQMQNIPKPYI